ncbi:SCO5717 family growth-regulating ATPase, partial [Streptomyces sp.]|uniref:SCO5717 family growth-regulating ATPase n=1 Tax=Streptomyces sp. TaxID=1931 RepID=UPI0035C1FBDC
MRVLDHTRRNTVSSDRDGIRGGWATPGDDQPDAESSAEVTGEFTIDYAPPAWYTQNASGSSGSNSGAPSGESSVSGAAGGGGGVAAGGGAG